MVPLKASLDQSTSALDGITPIWAYYPCCGTDTFPFSLLSPHWHGKRIPLEKCPNAFLYVDNSGEASMDGLNWADAKTRIQFIAAGRGALPPQFSVYRVVLHSLEREFRDQVNVVCWRCDHYEATLRLKEAEFKPSVVITVTDGSAMGGNEKPLNEFDQCAPWNPVIALRPNYLVTDHLYIDQAYRIPSPHCGMTVNAPCGVTLTSLGLMSSQWGRYGGWGFRGDGWGLGGATLFEVDPNPRCGELEDHGRSPK